MKNHFLSALVLGAVLSTTAFADDMSRMMGSMRQMQGAVAAGGSGQVDAPPPPGFFTRGRDSAPPGFWDNSGSGESNGQQFQRNMSGIAAGVRSAADMAEDGRRAAESAGQIRGNGGVVYQDRGQGSSRVTVDGRANGRANRSEVIINGKRYYSED